RGTNQRRIGAQGVADEFHRCGGGSERRQAQLITCGAFAAGVWPTKFGRARPTDRVHLGLGPQPSLRKAEAASCTVAWMSAAVCAADTNPASNALGAKYTPASSMRWKKRLKRSRSQAMMVAKESGTVGAK